jgi:hypothetical protein
MIILLLVFLSYSNSASVSLFPCLSSVLKAESDKAKQNVSDGKKGQDGGSKIVLDESWMGKVRISSGFPLGVDCFFRS